MAAIAEAAMKAPRGLRPWRVGRRIWLLWVYDPTDQRMALGFDLCAISASCQLLGVFTSSDRAMVAYHCWKREVGPRYAHWCEATSPRLLNDVMPEDEDIEAALR